jgi:hypothetical protein
MMINDEFDNISGDIKYFCIWKDWILVIVEEDISEKSKL